jgi:hypothetical protein
VPVVPRTELKLGDLLMTKHQGGLTHNVISIGSFFSGNFGTAGYVHAQIVCKSGPVEIAESHAGGLQIEAPSSPATVFRLRGTGGQLTPAFAKVCAERAAEVAVELNGRQQPNDAFGQYNYLGAGTSLFTTTSVNQGVKSQLQQIEAGTSRDRLFCSQFVVICYQVAILRLVRNGIAPQKLLPFELDAKAMEPAYLVSYLRRNAQHWLEVGDFAGGQG